MNSRAPKDGRNARKLRILLAEDHRVVRYGLKLLINDEPDMEVVGEASNGEEAVKKGRELRPDLVIMDLSMPGMTGSQATEILKADIPKIKILILTSYENQSYFQRMCQLNVSGYVLKSSASDELVAAIHKVAAGQFYFDATLANRALTGQFNGPASRAPALARELSERQAEVLRGVAFGYSNKELAQLLSLSVKTVESHKLAIGEKLGLHSRADMVRYGLVQGWLNDSCSFIESH